MLHKYRTAFCSDLKNYKEQRIEVSRVQPVTTLGNCQHLRNVSKITMHICWKESRKSISWTYKRIEAIPKIVIKSKSLSKVEVLQLCHRLSLINSRKVSSIALKKKVSLPGLIIVRLLSIFSRFLRWVCIRIALLGSLGLFSIIGEVILMITIDHASFNTLKMAVWAPSGINFTSSPC